MGKPIIVRDDNGNQIAIDEHNNTVEYRDDAGKLVKRDLSIYDVHTNAALANYCSGYNLAASIADIVAPPVLVDKASDKYYTWDKDDAFQAVQNLNAGDADTLPEVSPRLSSSTYTTQGYGLSTFVSDRVLANADNPLNPRLAAINRIMNVMSRARESRCVAVLQSATVFTGYTAAIAAGSKWNGGASSDPISDLHTAIEAALLETTHIVMSERVAHAFLRNPNVAKYTLYKDGERPLDMASIAQLSTMLGLPPIIVAKMKGKSSTAGTYGYIWGPHVTLIHNPPGVPVDGETIATAKTFRWNNAALGGVMDSSGFRVRTWRDESRGAYGGERIAVLTDEVCVATAANTGYLLTDAWQ